MEDALRFHLCDNADIKLPFECFFQELATPKLLVS
jgi:hypothetical protein